ncbi:MAG: hypothetical protein JRH11_16730 [Deltaproteobacteria bacterium]|nr:hypothetical protein [Deltaproteobacteria bacterium]
MAERSDAGGATAGWSGFFRCRQVRWPRRSSLLQRDKDSKGPKKCGAPEAELAQGRQELARHGLPQRVVVEEGALPDGVVHYVFREIASLSAAAPRVRIDASLAPREAVEEAVEAFAEEGATSPQERENG